MGSSLCPVTACLRCFAQSGFVNAAVFTYKGLRPARLSLGISARSYEYEQKVAAVDCIA
jgi:hypothetical protein